MIKMIKSLKIYAFKFEINLKIQMNVKLSKSIRLLPRLIALNREKYI